MKWIKKKQVVALVGEEEVKRIMDENDTSLLPTGAKLFSRRVGCVRRFGVYGYSYDNKDVEQALKED